MNIADPVSLLPLAVGLSMDVLSVSAITGLGIGSMNEKQKSRLATSFGAFHIFMPILGWLAGATVVDLISGFDHWAAFTLLAFVGGKMLFGGVKGDGNPEPMKILENRGLLLFSLAVSVDSVAVGLSFSLEKAPIIVPAIVIGLTAFVFTYIGVTIGSRTGVWIGRWSQVIGGLILIGIGLRVLLTHVLV